MNPQVVQAAKDLAKQTGLPFQVCLSMVSGVWTQLTNRPVYSQ